MTRLSCLIVLVLSAGAALAETREPKQFAQGIDITPQSTRPLVQVTLPDDVYRNVTRTNLVDVSVFDSAGEVVPHALCAAPESAAPTITAIDLPVVELQAAASSASGTQVDVQTADGTRVEVRDPNKPGTAVGTRAHVIDATGVEDALRAIEFDWQSADGSSEAQVRIESSEDLDRWQPVVGATTLLRAGKEGRQLRRERVPLPQRRYRYLRVERADTGLPIAIQSARAERVSAVQHTEPQWFAPTSKASTDQGQLFASDRFASVEYARLKLARENMTVNATLQSRADAKADWITRWSGEMYSIVTNGERKTSAPARFAATDDREWRLQVARGGATNVTLDLGYRPALLRFVTQGSAPFTLAYGSRQIDTSSARRCNDLLSDVEPKALRALIGEASLSPPRVLGGEAALKPLPKKTPVRLIVLWGVLVVGVTLLVGMALSLLKRVRPTG